MTARAMRSARHWMRGRFSPDRAREPLGRRAIALGLAIAIHLLGLVLLFTLSPQFRPRAPERESKSFPLLSISEREAPKPAARANRKKQAVGVPTPQKPAPPVPKTAPVPTPPLPIIPLTRDELASADIGKMRPNTAPKGGGAAPGASYGPGEGPGGAQLYNAEWYREPTDAELAFYMPQGGPKPGWAMIACQTAPDYRVENCRQLGESPAGSGLSRTLRLASWQFRVRPPRINGKPVMGAWVRIRFDFSVGKAG